MKLDGYYLGLDYLGSMLIFLKKMVKKDQRPGKGGVFETKGRKGQKFFNDKAGLRGWSFA